MTMFWKTWILIYWSHTLGSCGEMVCVQNICCHVAAFMFPFNLICNMTTFWLLTYWPSHRRWGRGGICGQNICYHVAAIRDSIQFDLLTPSLGFWGRGSASKIFAAMLLHSWFSLIWYAPWPYSEKVELWPIGPIPRVGGVCGKIFATVFFAFVILFNLICFTTMFWRSCFWPSDPIPSVGVGRVVG